jgi:hypothetical protein
VKQSHEGDFRKSSLVFLLFVFFNRRVPRLTPSRVAHLNS